jgi:hypothetical protein
VKHLLPLIFFSGELIMHNSIQRFVSGLNHGLDLYTENHHARTRTVVRTHSPAFSSKAEAYCLIVAIWGAIIVGFALAAFFG